MENGLIPIQMKHQRTSPVLRSPHGNDLLMDIWTLINVLSIVDIQNLLLFIHSNAVYGEGQSGLEYLWRVAKGLKTSFLALLLDSQYI